MGNLTKIRPLQKSVLRMQAVLQHMFWAPLCTTTGELEVCLPRQFPTGGERRKNVEEQSFKCSQMWAKTVSATIPTSPRSQLGGRVSVSKPLSTLKDVARGKDAQPVDLSGFYERKLCGG